MPYAVMRPVYERVDPEKKTEWCRVAEWVTVGTAESMADARRKFPPGYWAQCYSWVLEEIREIH